MKKLLKLPVKKLKNKKVSIKPQLYSFDVKRLTTPAMIIAGVDEAGRGPIAGPVVAAACILNYDSPLLEIYDSKKLTKNTRERLFELINKQAIAVGIGIVEHNIIDEINILNATKEAMKIALKNLKYKPDLVLTDAIKLDFWNGKFESLIKGDTLSASIAAASILAKVTRDRIMEEYSKQFPQYGFERNKGYPTKEHVSNVKKYGFCQIHRKSFSPVKELYLQKELM